jgi:hypothetical protein
VLGLATAFADFDESLRKHGVFRASCKKNQFKRVEKTTSATSGKTVSIRYSPFPLSLV